MKVKTTCEQCGTENVRDRDGQYYCPECGRWTWHNARYFPEADGNKVFAVDVYVTVCKCVKVEAGSGDEADRKAQAYVADLFRHRTDAEYIRALADEGFQDAEELETRVSGEADENGEIQYY